MSRADLLRERLAEAAAVCQGLLEDSALATAADGVVEGMVEAIRGGHKILFCGNGGSAADAQHLAAELLGRFSLDRRPFPALALADNTSALTAIANDYAYAEVYSRTVRGLGVPGDVLIGISTSGRSENVIEALKVAGQTGLTTVALVGQPGSPMEDSAQHVLRVPGPSTARIQEGQMVLAHAVIELVERELCRP